MGQQGLSKHHGRKSVQFEEMPDSVLFGFFHEGKITKTRNIKEDVDVAQGLFGLLRQLFGLTRLGEVGDNRHNGGVLRQAGN